MFRENKNNNVYSPVRRRFTLYKLVSVGAKLHGRVSMHDISLVLRKPVFGVPTRSDTIRAVQPQKMARGLKFRI